MRGVKYTTRVAFLVCIMISMGLNDRTKIILSLCFAFGHVCNVGRMTARVLIASTFVGS